MTPGGIHLDLRPLVLGEVGQAANVLARGMRDNPLHVAALGQHPAARARALAGLFRGFLAMEVAEKGRVVGAFQNGTMVGVCGMMRPGCCQLAPLEKVTLLPKLLWHCGFKGTGRFLAQFGNWSRHDLPTPHWHLGPVGIVPELQGKGIGSQLMRDFCAFLDAGKAAAWLETDKEINVTFYRRHGFEVVAEDTVNGVANWFMERSARA